MSRKNKPHFHEPVNSVGSDSVGSDLVGSDAEEPIEDTIEVGSIVLLEDPITGEVEVGTVLLVDGPYDPVPLGTDTGTADDFYAAETPITTVDFGAAADQAHDAVDQAKSTLGQGMDTIQDKGQDMAQNVTQAAQDIAGKAQDKAQDIAGKAQDAAQGIAGKAQDLSQTAADKAKEAAQKIADGASTAKTTVATAGNTSKNVVAGAAGSVGATLWSLIQRNPLQAIFFIASLVWLIRSNQATAAQPTASVSDVAGDAADKVGTVAGQVQVAASNLGSQVQTQAQNGAGWFARTLQSNPLAIGAMGIVAGAGLGFAVPESNYEHKTLGKTRDALADKAQAAAQDLTQKVTTVATTAVHEAIESGKAEAKNQGLTPSEPDSQEPAPQESTSQDPAPQQ